MRSPDTCRLPMARPTSAGGGHVPMARTLRRFALAISTAAVVLSLTASLAMAGEVTGSGKRENQNQGKSWCSFSGLNDKLEGEGPTGPQAQSYGQDVKLGEADPHVANSGFFCNTTHPPLGPNPNGTKCPAAFGSPTAGPTAAL